MEACELLESEHKNCVRVRVYVCVHARGIILGRKVYSI